MIPGPYFPNPLDPPKDQVPPSYYVPLQPVSSTPLMLKLTAEDVVITVFATPESEGLATLLAEGMSQQEAAALLERADKNVWQWCTIEVQAEYGERDGAYYTASAFTGRSTWQSRFDFVRNSRQYKAMVRQLLADINKARRARRRSG